MSSRIIRPTNDPRERFTIIANAAIRDPELSFGALGLLTWLLSHRNGWETSERRIAKTKTKVGIRAVRTLVAELTELGYLDREQARDAEGNFAGMNWNVTAELGVSAIRHHADDALANRAHKEEQGEENDPGVTPSAPSFASFWDAYPVKKGKANAEKKWKQLGAETRTAALERLPLYIADTNPGYVKHGSTYLNQRVWEDYEDRTTTTPPPPPSNGLRDLGPEDYEPLEPWSNVTDRSFEEARQALTKSKANNRGAQ